MIIPNGTIRRKIASSESRLDGKGYPIPAQDNWGEAVKCNIKTNNQANIGVTVNGNTFETASFEVLIEKQSFEADIVSLSRDGIELGVFQVLGKPERLNAVRNVKILVRCLSNV